MKLEQIDREIIEIQNRFCSLMKERLDGMSEESKRKYLRVLNSIVKRLEDKDREIPEIVREMLITARNYFWIEKERDIETQNIQTMAAKEPIWTKEAERRLERIPNFVRPMVRKIIEEYAKDKGYREITPDVMDKAKDKMGI